MDERERKYWDMKRAEAEEYFRNHPEEIYKGNVLLDVLIERIYRIPDAQKKFREFIKNHVHMGVIGVPFSIECIFSTIGEDYILRCRSCKQQLDLELYKNW